MQGMSASLAEGKSTLNILTQDTQPRIEKMRVDMQAARAALLARHLRQPAVTSISSAMMLPVLPLSKLNKMFFGYFDPENSIQESKNK